MKKYISLLLGTIMLLLLVGCGKHSKGTYYPDSSEMTTNLEDAGYEVEVTSNLDENYTGTYLHASKGDEYIEFYWLDDAEAVKYYTDKLEQEHANYSKLVSMEEDEKFGSFVFCSSNEAADKAGIVIVDVKVNVD